MPFNAILNTLTSSTGAVGATLLDRDGEVVASVSSNHGLDMDLVGAHHGIILNIIKDAAARQISPSDVRSVCISTDSARLAISTIKEEYFLVVLMDKSDLLGKTLFESQRAVRRIEEEIG